MLNKLFLVLTCFRLILPLNAIAQGDVGWFHGKQEISYQEFEARPGDSFIVDLKNSKGYLVNDVSGVYTSFPILSGQKRVVRYLGRTYFAATPEKTWKIQEKNIKGDRVTFSKSGEFLRLFDDGKSTSYGIHGHKYFQLMMDRGNPYVSYGCVLVADEILDVLEKSFVANGNSLTVITHS